MIFHNLDLIILIIVMISIVISLFRGFVKEALSLTIWTAAVLIALRYSDRLTPYIQHYISNKMLSYGLAFFVIFIIILIPGIVLSSLISKWLHHNKSIVMFDRILGMVFGGLRGILIVSVLLILVSTSQLTNSYYKKSTLAPHFQIVENWVYSFLPEKSQVPKYLQNSNQQVNNNQQG